jgi:hypothetical protein
MVHRISTATGTLLMQELLSLTGIGGIPQARAVHENAAGQTSEELERARSATTSSRLSA